MNDLGFVPIEQIQDVFSFEMSEIEDDIKRNGIPADYKIIFDWIDGIRGKLMSRAKNNMDEYLRKNPIVVNKKRELREADNAQSKSMAENWQEKVKNTRRAAIEEAYR